MTSDLQADLDAIADRLSDLADRLRHLLDDRGTDQAPLTSEIVAWLEDGDPDHIVKAWRSDVNEWAEVIAPKVGVWRERRATHGDQRQYGYRLGVREPATERVPLHQIVGRTLPGKFAPVRHVKISPGRPRYRAWVYDPPTGLAFDLTVAPDGTVEVLKDGSK